MEVITTSKAASMRACQRRKANTTSNDPTQKTAICGRVNSVIVAPTRFETTMLGIRPTRAININSARGMGVSPAMKQATSAEIVASGGAGELELFYDAVEAGATVLLAASVFHFNMIGIPELKDYLRGRGVSLR